MHDPDREAGPAPTHPLAALVARAARLPAAIPPSLVQLALRVAVAVPFWRSGLTKWQAPFELSDSAVYLFTEEFRLHILGGTFAYPAPGLMALLAAIVVVAPGPLKHPVNVRALAPVMARAAK